ncbi:co-chaperone YbbN [Lutibacter sp.]|jgi:thioredoxin-like negative regulator of GroEL|uniref:thioredoxin family protein n=1 Tax=Lutibacter sp. TaxID=1925666 RepID=UPI001A34D2F9|nr:thioredoxin family protein [Lutibacter sp.]MBI9040557.1 thioredoxin family protein [Lutibacter sp.]
MFTENTITTINDATSVLNTETAVLIYFSTISCSVGEAFEPKVRKLLATKFPKVKFYKVDLNLAPEVAASYSAFVEPTILVFFEGKETIRKSRTIGIFELEEAIKRPYELIFE